MSAISSVSSTTNPYQTTNQNDMAQILQDFGAIGGALQSGDLSTAQSALATFQQDLQGNSQTASSQPFGSNTQANTDYKSLVSTLQNGDLSGAQKAFTSLQTDLQGGGVGKTRGHHHHRSSNDANATQTTTSGTNT